MIHIDYRDSRPMYEQIRDSFSQLILAGVLETGAKMPSVRELALQLGINPNTIQRAYRELEADGFIVSIRGKGSFVADTTDAEAARREELFAKLRSLASELKALGVNEEQICSMIKGGDSHEFDD